MSFFFAFQKDSQEVPLDKSGPQTNLTAREGCTLETLTILCAMKRGEAVVATILFVLIVITLRPKSDSSVVGPAAAKPGEVPKKKEDELIGARSLDAGRIVYEPASCPHIERWLVMWLDSMGVGYTPLFVDVGQGMGHRTATWIPLLSGKRASMEMPMKLNAHLARKIDGGNLCGRCCDCEDLFTMSRQHFDNRPKSGRIVAFDPLAPLTAKRFWADPGTMEEVDDVRIEYVMKAAGPIDGPRNLTFEGGITTDWHEENDDGALPSLVDMTKLDTYFDSLLNQGKSKVVDLLFIDTDGYESEVLKGAEELIARSRVGVLVFSMMANWKKNRALLNAINGKEQDYKCYFPMSLKEPVDGATKFMAYSEYKVLRGKDIPFPLQGQYYAICVNVRTDNTAYLSNLFDRFTQEPLDANRASGQCKTFDFIQSRNSYLYLKMHGASSKMSKAAKDDITEILWNYFSFSMNSCRLFPELKFKG